MTSQNNEISRLKKKDKDRKNEIEGNDCQATSYNTVYAVRYAHANAWLRLALRIHRYR